MKAEATLDHPYSQTLAQSFVKTGVGLHTGFKVQVRVLPAEGHHGRYFVRVDLPGCPTIPAQGQAVRQTQLSTELGQGDAKVRTVEHLLAALWGMGIDHARIEVDGPEVPLLDGSAQPWVEAIAQAGIQVQTPSHPHPRRKTHLKVPIVVQGENDSFVLALPASDWRFTYGIDFDVASIGQQWQSWAPQESSFAEAIAPARTFGLLHQIDELKRIGLIQGGTLENALVCGAEGWLNPPLRFTNEPVRHKLLDLMGDLSLQGDLPCAHFLAYKASYRLHVQLLQSLPQG